MVQHAIDSKQALALFSTLSVEQQTTIMLAHSRIARCQACPQDWPLASKVGVADLCAGRFHPPTSLSLIEIVNGYDLAIRKVTALRFDSAAGADAIWKKLSRVRDYLNQRVVEETAGTLSAEPEPEPPIHTCKPDKNDLCEACLADIRALILERKAAVQQ